MPIVLRNRTTGEIACGMMKNIYQFAYYGALWWDNREIFEEQSANAPEDEKSMDWEPVEVKEEKLKLFNVKLNNDPRRRLYVDENGVATVRKGEGGGEEDRR